MRIEGLYQYYAGARDDYTLAPAGAQVKHGSARRYAEYHLDRYLLLYGAGVISSEERETLNAMYLQRKFGCATED